MKEILVNWKFKRESRYLCVFQLCNKRPSVPPPHLNFYGALDTNLYFRSVHLQLVNRNGLLYSIVGYCNRVSMSIE